MTIKDKIFEEEKKGNIVVNGDRGLEVYSLREFVNQTAEGFLNDLNRDEATILTWIDDPKWINDYACAMVIRYLMNKLN